MITYRFLTEDDLSAMHSTFATAFADYYVDMSLTQDQFVAHLTDTGVQYNCSVGAFAETTMVGLLLNGVGDWQGTLTAYDAGTGVIPGYRGQGIAGTMLRFAAPQLREQGINHYLLEVIQANEPAIRAYHKLGFVETRTLQCISRQAGSSDLYLSTESMQTKQTGQPSLEIRPITQPDWALLQSFWDWQPAWQNSLESIRRMSVRPEIIGVLAGETCLGYAVYWPNLGRIAQLAVAKSHRRRGVGSLLIQAIQERTTPDKALSMINIEGEAQETLAFFATQGFQETVSQYEMCLTLDQL